MSSDGERKVLHEPTLPTITMVEEAILDAEDYPTQYELWKSLPRKMQYQTLQRVLDYLEKSGKICFNEDTILWIGIDTPEFREMLKSCRKVR